MTAPGRERQLALTALAGRAPSPHNIQPARWRFVGDSAELWEETARWLSVGDPGGRDNRIALGMAWEGMTIALSGESLRLALESPAPAGYPPAQPGCRLVARGRILPGAEADPLLPSLATRSSYRGRFASADSSRLRALDGCIASHRDIACALPESAARRVAEWYDLSAAEGLDSPAFARELYSWMRFSRRDLRWTRDGLSADCLCLSAFEAWGASVALMPTMVRVLAALSLTRLLVSEANKVKGAARIVMIHASAGTDTFDAGRAWYRFWLDLDRAGIVGVPMSALSDSRRYSAEILAAWPLPYGRKLLNVMRLGPVPAAGAARSSRLPAVELLLE